MILEMGFFQARSRLLPWIAASGAMLSMLAATHRHGLGVSLDSVVYAGAAESVAERRTLDVPLTWWDAETARVPLSHFPPAVPLALAAVGGSTGADPYVAARWLNAGCIFVSVLLATRPIATSPFALIVMFALLAGPWFTTMHLWLWSEPLFLLLALVCVRLAATVSSQSGRTGRIAALGVCCGLATLTRYAGVSLMAGVGLLLLLSREPRAVKIRRLLWCGGAYVATVGPWLWWLATTGGAPRSLGIYTEDAWSRVVVPLVRTFADVFVPSSWPLPTAIAVIGAAVLLVVRTDASSAPREAAPTALVCGVLLAVNVAFVVGARLFADAGIPMDERILSTAVLFLAIALSDLAKVAYPIGLPVVASVLVACVAVGNVFSTAPHFLHAARHGHGYLSEPWVSSETLAWLRDAPRDLTIFSNAPDVVCAWLPVTAKYTPASDEADRLAEFATRVQSAAPAAVVLFDDPHEGWLMSRDLLKDVPVAHEVRSFSDGVVMLSRGSAASRNAPLRRE
ncbi:MAG TPA: hypothetical protein VFO62_00640 [Candidatus Binatia bacterium]|nr:hypothetical protein [Candidatus Binatia bacterium]